MAQGVTSRNEDLLLRIRGTCLYSHGCNDDHSAVTFLGFVQVAGTDEMTTCVGVVMWNPVNRRLDKGNNASCTLIRVGILKHCPYFPGPIHYSTLHTVTFLCTLTSSPPPHLPQRACVAHLDSPKGMPGGVRGMADSIGASPQQAVDVSGRCCQVAEDPEP